MPGSRSLFSRLAQPRALALGMALGAGFAAGCNDNDACKGHSETCLSVTLEGVEGVSRADRLLVMFQRKPKPEMPMMPLESPTDLPFKIAVLWPDGAATFSVRTYLDGVINGVTAEVTLDLRNGAHDKRRMTLYPPLPGQMGTEDMRGSPLPDMRVPPVMDLLQPADQLAPPDLLQPEDFSTPVPPPDLSPAPGNDM